MTLDRLREYGDLYVGMAARDAVRYHGRQARKDGTPYVGHLFRVAGNVGPDPVEACLALLHDLVEDHYDVFNLSDVDAAYGPEFARLVDAVTHRPGEARRDYISRVIDGGPAAQRVKLADLLDNMTPLADPELVPWADEATRLRLLAKYERDLDQLTAGMPGGDVAVGTILRLV